MTFHGRKPRSEQLEAWAETRRREDAAPRLRDAVPGLRSMRMRFEDRRPDGHTVAMPYTRHVVVATGPAMFAVRCTEPRCDGRHELTNNIMNALRKGLRHYEGESVCQGNVGDLACDRTLLYFVDAEFEELRV